MPLEVMVQVLVCQLLAEIFKGDQGIFIWKSLYEQRLCDAVKKHRCQKRISPTKIQTEVWRFLNHSLAYVPGSPS